jgi:hypothetical protein
METKLNQIKGLNVLHLRAGYFMENTLVQAGIIKNLGTMAGPIDAELRLPMIATKDIGAAAAEALLKLDFKGPQTRELQTAGLELQGSCHHHRRSNRQTRAGLCAAAG